MAVTSVDTTLFGANGVSDPHVYEPGLMAIKRRIDTTRANVAASTAYQLIPLPKAFVATAVVLGVGIAGSGTVSVTVPDATDATNDKSLMSAGSIATTGKTVVPLGTPVVVDGDVACITFSAANTAAVIDVAVIGYSANGDSIADIEFPDWRVGQSDEALEENMSSGDPYTNAASMIPHTVVDSVAG